MAAMYDSMNDAIDAPEGVQISIRRKGEAGLVSLEVDGFAKLLEALEVDGETGHVQNFL